MTGEKSILVLGVGNILYTDEGLGVRALQILERDYCFSPNVRLVDGGTQGYLLMDTMMSCDKLIVLDAVRVINKNAVRGMNKNANHLENTSTTQKTSHETACSIHILKGEDLRQSIAFSDSLHQTDLLDTLVMCELAGHRPDTIVIGMEPVDYTSQSLNVTPTVATQMPEFCKITLAAIERFGGQWQLRLTNE